VNSSEDDAIEVPFRILALIMGILSLAIRRYYQRRAERVEKVKDEWQRRDRSPYLLPTYAALPVALYICTTRVKFAHLRLPLSLRWLGAIFGGAGLALFAWTHHSLGTNWSGKLELSKEHALVTSGPYRWVRHPMYTSFFLSAAGNVLMTANWLASVPSLVAVTWMYLGRYAAEEEMMAEKFGEAYQLYMQKTGRLLPRCQGLNLRRR
jgi:protein-S-isoprenylcysteine O-methyltransferase Ste14